MRRLLLLCALLGLADPASAGSLLALDLDDQISSIAVSGPPPDSRVLTGALTLELGALPPLAATTTFDLRALTLVAVGTGTLAIGLDPDIANPGAGVLNVAGQFLIPTLFLQLDDGITVTDLALANVAGSFTMDDPGCPYTACLDTYFELDGGATFGTISVRVAAIPEPSTGALVGLGTAALAWRARRKGMTR